MQSGYVQIKEAEIQIILPSPRTKILSGLTWGKIDAFPTPAYWAYQVLARRIIGNTINYKIGNSLLEETVACLLGGHGIPAKIGLAAFEHLKKKGGLSGENFTEKILYQWLSEPLMINGKEIHYRFAKQKAKYISLAIKKINKQKIDTNSGKKLRNWLMESPGIGYKTASWIARNWLDADDIAILDIHLLRAGRITGFFPNNLTVNKNYIELEEMFIGFSEKLGVRPSELDAVIWKEMMSACNSVKSIFSAINKNQILLQENVQASTESQLSPSLHHIDDVVCQNY